MGIGSQIRDVRHLKGLTLQDLAERAAVTAAHLSRVENEKVSLSRRVLEQIAAALGVPPDLLLQKQGNSQVQQTVVDRRGRSSAERYLAESLAKAMYEDVTVRGMPLAKAGWRSVEQLGEGNASILGGMAQLGIVEKDSGGARFRLCAEANRQHDGVSRCLRLQEYRNEFSSDIELFNRAMEETDQLLDSLASLAGDKQLRAVLGISGLTLAIREARLEVTTDELLQAGALLGALEATRFQSAARIAFEILPRTVTGIDCECDATLEVSRNLWHATPACRKSKHFLCSLFAVGDRSETERFWVAKVSKLNLADAPLSLLLSVFGSWVVWCYLERCKVEDRPLLPVTDEARVEFWAPRILNRLHQRLAEVPDDLVTCTQQHRAFLEKYEAVGPTCDDADEHIIDGTAHTVADGHSEVFELLRFPWDG